MTPSVAHYRLPDGNLSAHTPGRLLSLLPSARLHSGHPSLVAPNSIHHVCLTWFFLQDYPFISTIQHGAGEKDSHSLSDSTRCFNEVLKMNIDPR